MGRCNWQAVLASVVLGGASAAIAEVPPAPDALTENSAALWGAEAQYATAATYDDTSRGQVGDASLRFETTGGFDTWLWAPESRNANWDLLGAGCGGLEFWVYAENPNMAFQNNSPWIRVCTGPNDYFQFTPAWDILNDARYQWIKLRIPFTGDDIWSRSTVGNPDLTDVDYIEIHADTWGAGFTLWFDGFSFDVPFAPPNGQKAFAGNGEVALEWDPFDDLSGGFDHYAVYRATTPFSNVAGMTPIATVNGINTTEFTDTTAANGTSYHYAITAVFSGGAETSEVDSIGPRTPRDETDLQMVTIARTQLYPRYAPTYTYYEVTEPGGFGPYTFSAATGLGEGQNASTQRWPAIGDTLTYVATVRNRGTNAWSGVLNGTWTVDEVVAQQPSRTVTLQPGETTTFSFALVWDDQMHDVGFSFDAADDRPENNTLSRGTKSVAYLSYIDQTYFVNFREETADYPEAFSDDFIDWLNNHMKRFNELLEQAGSDKRVHFGVLELLDDEEPDPVVDRINYAVFPFRYQWNSGTLRMSGYYRPNDDIDYGLLHEMGHQLGLIDLYRMDLTPGQNQVSGIGYSACNGLMRTCAALISEHSALAMNHWLDDAHGYYGQYLYEMPEHVRMRFIGAGGQPLEDATVRVYQKVERPGQGEVITNQVKFEGQTDANGEYTLPNVEIDPSMVPPSHAGDVLHDNPFGYVHVVGTNGLLHFEIEHNGHVDYAWLDISEVNLAYWHGATDVATFERELSLGGTVQCYPPPDMAENNADQWTSWAQDGTITLFDDADFGRVGETSLRVEATGGFDNYVRYPGEQLAEWDLTGVESLRFRVYAINNNGGFQGPSPVSYTHLTLPTN